MPEDKPTYEGPERRRDFADQVAQAAVWTAAQEEVEKQRKHDVKQAGFRGGWLGFFASLVLLIPSVAYTGHVVASNATDNARRNCEVQAAGRPVGNGRAFVTSEILAIADQAFQQFPKRFQDAAVARMNEDLRGASTSLQGALGFDDTGRPVPLSVLDSFTSLSAYLQYLPPIDCAKLIS